MGRGPAAALLVLLLVPSCAGSITREELQMLLAREPKPVLLDVRTPGEFGDGHIPGAVNASVFDLKARLAELLPPKERTIVVICEHGPRATFAGFMLKQAGYTDVRSLDGAMKAWRQQGLPVEK